ncbi:hypothetical protein [Bacillus sp. AK031]
MFLDGYRKSAPLSDSEIERTPQFLRVHNLITYQMLREALDENAGPKQPEWINELIAKLEKKLLQYEEEVKAFHS